MTPAHKRDLAEQAQHLCAGLETCPEALQPSPSGHTREQLHRLLDRAIDQLRGEHEFPKRWPKARVEREANAYFERRLKETGADVGIGVLEWRH